MATCFQADEGMKRVIDEKGDFPMQITTCTTKEINEGPNYTTNLKSFVDKCYLVVLVSFLLLLLGISLLQSTLKSNKFNSAEYRNYVVEPDEHLYKESCFEWIDNVISAPAGVDWCLTTEKMVCPQSQWRHGCCQHSPLKRYNISERCVNFTQFLDSHKNKMMCFFGDSLSLNTYEGLLSTLRMNNIVFRSVNKNNTKSTFVPSSNLSIFLYEFWYLHLDREEVVLRPLDMDYMVANMVSLRREVKSCDIAIVNIGVHFGKPLFGYTVSFYLELLLSIKKILENDMRIYRHKQHIYRLTYPQHFRQSFGSDSGGDFQLTNLTKVTRNSSPCLEAVSQRPWSDVLATSIFRNTSVVILDYFRVLKNMGFYHAASNHGGKGDCTHFCWNQHLWRPMWGMLTDVVIHTRLG